MYHPRLLLKLNPPSNRPKSKAKIEAIRLWGLPKCREWIVVAVHRGLKAGWAHSFFLLCQVRPWCCSSPSQRTTISEWAIKCCYPECLEPSALLSIIGLKYSVAAHTMGKGTIFLQRGSWSKSITSINSVIASDFSGLFSLKLSRVSSCSPGWPQTQNVGEDNLVPASISLLLELQVCTPHPVYTVLGMTGYTGTLPNELIILSLERDFIN